VMGLTAAAGTASAAPASIGNGRATLCAEGTYGASFGWITESGSVITTGLVPAGQCSTVNQQGVGWEILGVNNGKIFQVSGRNTLGIPALGFKVAATGSTSSPDWRYICAPSSSC
jgi:hypothetical protein